MATQTVRVDLLPNEIEQLAFLSRGRGQYSWWADDIDDINKNETSGAIRAGSVVLALGSDAIRVSCLAIDLLFGDEAFRLCIERIPAPQRLAGPPVDASPSSSVKYADEIEHGTKTWLIYREHEYDGEGVLNRSGMTVIVPDALLINGPERQVLVQVNSFPTWLSVTRDPESISRVVDSAVEIRMV